MKTKEDFVETSTEVHGNKYNYDDVNYINNDVEVKILCIKCNKYFFQLPRIHISGHGCRECGIETATVNRTKISDDFFDLLDDFQKENYIYDVSNFNGTTKNKIRIFHKKCGKWFEQIPTFHLSGNGCPHCSNGPVSKIEIKWLNYLNVPDEYRQQTLFINKKQYRVDAIDYVSKIIYEFYGDYWHGNPNVFNLDDVNIYNKKTFRELYDHTIKRQKELEDEGYKIIFIWENDFRKQLKEIKNEKNKSQS